MGQDDPEDCVNYFKVLMLVGKYTQALEELAKVQEFTIAATHLSIIMNELGILKTRVAYFKFI